MSRLELHGVDKSFGPVRVLTSVDLRAEAGEVTALVGDNVVEQSTNMPWFNGQPLLGHLEDVTIKP